MKIGSEMLESHVVGNGTPQGIEVQHCFQKKKRGDMSLKLYDQNLERVECFFRGDAGSPANM